VLGEDVLVASDARPGRLVKLDLANGSVMMEAPLSGGVLGSLATDGKRVFLLSDDGLAQCLDAASGAQLWKTPIAPHTDSTPAVDAGTVYLADQQGTAFALDAATGAVRWRTPLGQEFTRCPVVAGERVLFGCRDGKLVALARADGKELWSVRTRSRFAYEPVVLADKVLYFDGKAGMLADLATGAAAPLMALQRTYNQETRKWEEGPGPFLLPDEPMTSISYYKGRLLIVPRQWDSGHEVLYVNHPWHLLGGVYYVLSPPAPAGADGEGSK